MARSKMAAVAPSQPKFETFGNWVFKDILSGSLPVLEEPSSAICEGEFSPFWILAIEEKKFDSLFVVRPPT